MIAIVEDNEDMLDLLGLVIEREGRKVALCKNTNEALACLERATPRLLIVDYRLNGNTAEDLLTRLKTKLRVPTLLITGLSAAMLNPRELRELGIFAVLHKPFDIQELLDAIKPWL